MAKQAGHKEKILRLRDYLERQSDEEHPLSMGALLAELERWGIVAERKSIYSDLQVLNDYGLDIEYTPGCHGGWYLGSRTFQLPELKLLVDAVQSAKFITRRKSGALISKLEELASVHQARQLQRQVFVDGRVKHMNESIYYNVDTIHTAIAQGRQVKFYYFDYDVAKEKIRRRDGARYYVVPYGLVWDNANYYLVGKEPGEEKIRHYRVDKMDAITITATAGQPPKKFNLAVYAGKFFSMYSGREGRLTLRCPQRLMAVMMERFGQDLMAMPQDEGYFHITQEVVVSPQLWGWLLGLGGGVEVVSPQWARDDYKKALERALQDLS